MRRLHLCAVTVSMLVLTGCATMNVSSYVERDIDFVRLHTYAWGPAERMATGDPRLDNNPFFHDYFRHAVDEHLAAKGFRKVTSDTPDLLLHFHATVTQSFAASDAGRETCGGGHDCEPRFSEYETGTLVLDVTDARTSHVVWRGSARQAVDALIDNQDWMEEYLAKAVARMMERFPIAVHDADRARQRS
jgi:hypothetical protein